MKSRTPAGRISRSVSLVIRVGKAFVQDEGPFVAAGIAFFAFFSIFPLSLVAVALLSYLYTPSEAVADAVRLAALFVPPDMVGFLDAHLRQIFGDSTRIGLTGFIILLWSGRWLFRAMEFALHKAWGLPLERGWLAGNLLAMALSLLCTAVFLGVGAMSLALSWIGLVLHRVELPAALAGRWTLDEALLMSRLHSWVIVPLAVALMFLLLYILLPSKRVPVSMAIPGALFSSLAWKVSSWVYLTYIVRFASSNPFYATVWGFVGLLVWLYIEAIVFILGAELVVVIMDPAERLALTTPASNAVTGTLVPKKNR